MGHHINMHCPHGHLYTSENTYVRADGCRVCRTCLKNQKRASRQRRLRYSAGYRDQICPICDDRWFVSASSHIARAHGIRMPGLSSADARLNRAAITRDLGLTPAASTRRYYRRWAKVVQAEMDAGGFYVQRLAKRWRMTPGGASTRIRRLEEAGLVTRPRLRKRNVRGSRDKCRNGHPVSPETIMIHGDKRRCRECRRNWNRMNYRRRKAA